MNIVIRHLSKAFGEKVLWKDLNLVIPENGCSVLMGASGCGKTTLLRILMGLEEEDEGEILESQRIRQCRKCVVFQEDRLCEGISAVDNVLAVLPGRTDREMIRRDLEKTGLCRPFEEPVRNYSGGMKRRVAVVRACMAEGELVLMDEPLRGLDRESREKTAGYIREKTKGRTLIITSHDQEDAGLLGGEVVRLDGRS